MGQTTRNPSRRFGPWLAAAFAVALVLGLPGVAAADFWTPESGGSSNADAIDNLYKFTLVIAAVIFFGVEGALFYSLIKFKARKGAVAAQIRGNTRLEIAWTVGAAVIVLVLAVATFIQLPAIRNPETSGESGLDLASSGVAPGVLVASGPTEKLPPDRKSLAIKVNGQQYIWRYTYPDGDDNTLNNPFSYEEMVVPTETTVTLDIQAQDVAHSWWIPKLGGKFDAIPGYTNYTWFKVPAKMEGKTFEGQCAELCGRGHANMTARVRAVSPADFEAFIAQRRKDTKAADEAAAEQREVIEAPAEKQPDAGKTSGPTAAPVP
ncbi:MAG: cytochrome c oxidase subunit II [Actinomycetota bacterium]|nr:cytochrome c oxidase subunit II [Actinomycetota bacterium]